MNTVATHDIYLEFNGVKIAVVQSYKSIHLQIREYKIELNRVYATDRFIALKQPMPEKFDFVVEKPDKIIRYTECIWNEPPETTYVIDKATIIASSRKETARK